MREILTKWRTAIISGIASLVLIIAVALAFGSGGNSGADAAAGGDVDSSPQEVTETSGRSADTDGENQGVGGAVDASKVDDASGGDGVASSAGSWEPHAVSETPKNYGTSPANIANGGYVAYSNGKTYFIGDPRNSDKPQNSYDRTAICVFEDGFTGRQLLYQAEDYENNGNSGYTRELSCLHVTGDKLYFCESYTASSGAKRYDIVRTNLEGIGREYLARDLRAMRLAESVKHLDAYMWIDDGSIYYLDKGSLWKMPLDGGGREHIVEVGDGYCSVDDGIVYYTTDDRFTLMAKDLDTEATKQIYTGDDMMDDEETDGLIIQSFDDKPLIAGIQPDGDSLTMPIQYGMAFSNCYSGYLHIDKQGNGGTYFGSEPDDDNYNEYFGAFGLLACGDTIYTVVGQSHGLLDEGIAIVSEDGNDDSDTHEQTILLQTGTVNEDNTVNDEGDGYIGNWLCEANGRLYFASDRLASIIAIGSEYTEQQLYDRATPWSMKLDGSDLRHGVK